MSFVLAHEVDSYLHLWVHVNSTHCNFSSPASWRFLCWCCHFLTSLSCWPSSAVTSIRVWRWSWSVAASSSCSSEWRMKFFILCQGWPGEKSLNYVLFWRTFTVILYPTVCFPPESTLVRSPVTRCCCLSLTSWGWTHCPKLKKSEWVEKRICYSHLAKNKVWCFFKGSFNKRFGKNPAPK